MQNKQSFAKIEVYMMGLQFPGSDKLPVLGSNITVPSDQAEGKIPEVIELV